MKDQEDIGEILGHIIPKYKSKIIARYILQGMSFDIVFGHGGAEELRAEKCASVGSFGSWGMSCT